jgi:DNA-binding XRE family transcriptional regulator
MASHSVKQAAKLLGVDPQTLFRWIWNGKVHPSIAIPMNGRKLYRFTDEDIAQVRRYKSAHYWEGRGGSKPKAGRGMSSRHPHWSRKKEKK